MTNIKKLKIEMLEKVDNLSPTELSKLCVNVVKTILNRDPIDNTIKNNFEQSKVTLVNLIIEHNIKINGDKNNE